MPLRISLPQNPSSSARDVLGICFGLEVTGQRTGVSVGITEAYSEVWMFGEAFWFTRIFGKKVTKHWRIGF